MKTSNYQEKCDGPAEEFVAFAKRFTITRGKKALADLAASSAADEFAKRLLEEALSGAAHAGQCMALVGYFAKDSFWIDKFRSSDASGSPPAPNQIPSKHLEDTSRALLEIFPDEALPWVALTFLTTNRASLREKILTILISASPTPQTLLDALAMGVHAYEPTGVSVSRGLAGRVAEAVDAFVAAQSPTDPVLSSNLGRLATVATRTDLARLSAALLLLRYDEDRFRPATQHLAERQAAPH